MFRAAIYALALTLTTPAGMISLPVCAETLAPAQSVPPEQMAALTQTMQMADVFAVMAEEGKSYGATIEEQMFPGRDGAAWAAQVAAIYDPAVMQPVFAEAFSAALADDPDAVAAAEAFYGSTSGQEILKLEIEARRAILDPAVEEEAQVLADTMKSDRDPKLRQMRRLIEASDMIEMNVAGALSANLAFFQGLASEHAPGMDNDPEAIMAEVWGQEESIRVETANWLIPFMALAYQPVSEADLKAYVDFSDTPEGKRVNAALFAGFDALGRKVSFALGRSAAKAMAGTDI